MVVSFTRKEANGKICQVVFEKRFLFSDKKYKKCYRKIEVKVEFWKGEHPVIERVSTFREDTKIFLKLDLVVTGILCIYTLCTNCDVSIFLVVQYPISLFMVAVSLHYTISSVNTTLYQKKIHFHGLFRTLLEAIDGIFCGMLPFGYVLLSFPFPFWNYFLVFSALTAYMLLLNRFGKYPFIDCFV